jgi:hypothetical protein
LRPDLYLTVLDPATTDFKKSAKEFLDRADALILHDSREQHATELQAAQFAAEWKGISLKPLAARPIFRIHPPLYVTSEIAGFVRNSLVAPAEADSSRPDSGSK